MTKFGVLKRINTYKLQRKSKDFVLGLFMAIILIGICYIILSPIIGMIALAFMNVDDLFNPMVFLVPMTPTFDNIRQALQHLRFWNTLWYTLRYAGGLGLLHVLTASIIGYGFARYRFYGSKILFAVVLLTFIIPPQTYMVPLWFRFRFFFMDTNLIDTYTPIILLTITGMGLRSGLFIYIFRQFFMGVPRELSEAAAIDGCGHFRTYAQIMMPNAKPAIVTVMMFALVWHYGDTFYTGVLLNRPMLMHNSLGQVLPRWQVYMASARHGSAMLTQYELMQAQMVIFASVLLVVLPILVIYAIMQRQFIEGIERSGIVG